MHYLNAQFKPEGKKNRWIECKIFQGFFKNKQKSTAHPRLSFYYCLLVVENCLEKPQSGEWGFWF